MSIFSQILDKLGLHKDKQQATTGTAGSAPQKPAAPAPAAKKPTDMVFTPAQPSATGSKTTSQSDREEADNITKQPVKPAGAAPTQAAAAAPAAVKPMSQVDVTSMLEQKAKGTGLNWKQSISDLLFLLGIDNSLEARKELAKELGAPQEVMGDSARMNTWLHKTVLQKIAENGGNIPKDLLD